MAFLLSRIPSLSLSVGNRLVWRGFFRPVPQPDHVQRGLPTAIVTRAPYPRMVPLSPARRRSRADCGEATVIPWRGPCEAPMWGDPHGNHTGTSPGRHRHPTGTGGWAGDDGGGAWEPSLPQKWTERGIPPGRGRYEGIAGMRHLLEQTSREVACLRGARRRGQQAAEENRAVVR
jgi:hypothetical protein